MSSHPFCFSYIGLGLLDEASIRDEGSSWIAVYPDPDGRPYLRVEIDPAGVTLTELDADGERVALTRERDLGRAIGVHGADALEGDVSRFLVRLCGTGLPAWVPLHADVRYVFIPAIALATTRVPHALDRPWTPPAPGPLARRLGFDFKEDDESPVRATLWRTYESEREPRPEPILVRRITVPAILVPELAGAIASANGRVRHVEWRPFLEVQPGGRLAQSWPSPPRLGDRPEGHLSAYAIVEEGSAGLDALSSLALG